MLTLLRTQPSVSYTAGAQLLSVDEWGSHGAGRGLGPLSELDVTVLEVEKRVKDTPVMLACSWAERGVTEKGSSGLQRATELGPVNQAFRESLISAQWRAVILLK